MWLVTLAIWAQNPYAAALLVPALHLWLWAVDPDLRLVLPARLAMIALGAGAGRAGGRLLRRQPRLRPRRSWPGRRRCSSPATRSAWSRCWNGRIVLGCLVSAATLVLQAARRPSASRHRSRSAGRSPTPARARSAAPSRRSAGRRCTGDWPAAWHHGAMRRLIRDVSSVLILSGLLLVLDAGVTLVWQEPVTAAIGMVLRTAGQQELPQLPHGAAVAHGHRTRWRGSCRCRRGSRYLARRERDQVKTGDAIGQIDIPRIGHTYNIIEGTGTQSPGGGAGPLSLDGVPRDGPDGRGRRPPHDVSGAVSLHQRAAFRRPDRASRCPTAGSPMSCSTSGSSQPTEVSVVDNVGYDRLVHVGLQSAVQRGAADHRVRPAALGATARARRDRPTG